MSKLGDKITKERGQVMLLTVMLLSSAILGATSVAGLLVLFQLRQASDIASSTKSIFAADAGIECAFFNEFRTIRRNCGEVAPIFLDNGAQYRTIFVPPGSVKSIGFTKRTARSLEVRF